MAKLPPPPDPTLAAIDAKLEAAENAIKPRGYLGMSAIGKPCARDLWYGFRFVSPKGFTASTLKLFADGHLGEDVQAERLRMVDGVELHTHTPDGGQYGFKDHGGHFAGHMDGAIRGLLQAPKTWHVWEHKQTNEKKFAKLEKLKIERGEKNALAEWDEVYHGQAIVYMHYSGMTRHYLTAATPGGRQTVSCRTDADEGEAERLKAKALTIITSDRPLDKLSESPAWYQCKWCDHHALCHETAAPQVNCRTCIHATPELDGDARWSCALKGHDLTIEQQHTGCGNHLYIPALLVNFAEQVDASDDAIEYKNKLTGAHFWNGQSVDQYTSREIYAARDKRALGDAEVEALREAFGGEVVG